MSCTPLSRRTETNTEHLYCAHRYDFDNLDTVPEDALVVFSVATYGEGEPTDNAVALMDFLKEDPQFTNGSTLENLHYVIFGRASAAKPTFGRVQLLTDPCTRSFCSRQLDL